MLSLLIEFVLRIVEIVSHGNTGNLWVALRRAVFKLIGMAMYVLVAPKLTAALAKISPITLDLVLAYTLTYDRENRLGAKPKFGLVLLSQREQYFEIGIASFMVYQGERHDLSLLFNWMANLKVGQKEKQILNGQLVKHKMDLRSDHCKACNEIVQEYEKIYVRLPPKGDNEEGRVWDTQKFKKAVGCDDRYNEDETMERLRCSNLVDNVDTFEKQYPGTLSNIVQNPGRGRCLPSACDGCPCPYIEACAQTLLSVSCRASTSSSLKNNDA